jgi:hypothetical protein
VRVLLNTTHRTALQGTCCCMLLLAGLANQPSWNRLVLSPASSHVSACADAEAAANAADVSCRCSILLLRSFGAEATG